MPQDKTTALREAQAIGHDITALFERIAKLYLVEPLLAEHALKFVDRMRENVQEFIAKTGGN